MITLERLRADRFKGLRGIDIIFPSRGSVLIEGANESGKSTLFETVYVALYGEPLTGEDESHPKLDDLIAFDSRSATVELTFSVGTTQVTVRRELSRGRPQKASVTVAQPGASDESVNGARAVNERVLRELGGLNGDCLLNSCFVEQKELERLESLSRSEREKAIERLLGLERLTKLEKEYRLSLREALDRQQRADQRRDLALALVEAQAADAETADARERAVAAQIAAKLEKIDYLGRRIQDLSRQATSGDAGLRAVEERLARADYLAQVIQQGSDLDKIAREAHQTTSTLAAVEARRALRAAEIRQRDLPEAEARQDAFTRARVAVEARDYQRQIVADQRAARERMLAAASARGRVAQEVADAARGMREAEVAAQEADRLAQSADRCDALAAWAEAAEITDRLKDSFEREASARRESEAADAFAQRRKAALARAQPIAAVGIAVGALSMAIGFAIGLYLLAGVGLVLAIGAGASVIPRWQASQRAGDKARSARQRYQSLLDAHAAARAVGADPERMARLRARLDALNVPRDLTPDAARAEVQRSLASLGKSVEEIRSATLHARDMLTAARANYAAVLRRQSDLADSGEAGDIDPPDLDTSEQALREAKATCATELAAVDLPAEIDLAGLSAAAARHEAALAALRKEWRDLTSARDPRHEEIAQHRADLVDRWRLWRERARSCGISPGDDLVDSDTIEDAVLATLPDLLAQLHSMHDALNPDGAKRDRDALLGAMGGHSQSQQDLILQRDEMRAEIARMLAERHIVLAAEAMTHDVCVAAWPLVGAMSTGDTDIEHAREQDARNRAYAARDRVKKTREMLGLTVEETAALDLTDCERDLADAHRQGAIAERALRVIADARQQIMQHVLPATERNMRRILPLLTAGRYYDAMLRAPDGPDGTPGEVDYRIRVFERAANRFVGKSIFSGGARDQCSLALRLAFALATMPQELGVAPGFLFLDEPLSAFDSERAAALVELLTQGDISRAFEQVVVISHAHAFDRGDFRYHLRMERGRVAASDLPRESSFPALATSRK